MCRDLQPPVTPLARHTSLCENHHRYLFITLHIKAAARFPVSTLSAPVTRLPVRFKLILISAGIVGLFSQLKGEKKKELNQTAPALRESPRVKNRKRKRWDTNTQAHRDTHNLSRSVTLPRIVICTSFVTVFQLWFVHFPFSVNRNIYLSCMCSSVCLWTLITTGHQLIAT